MLEESCQKRQTLVFTVTDNKRLVTEWPPSMMWMPTQYKLENSIQDEMHLDIVLPTWSNLKKDIPLHCRLRDKGSVWFPNALVRIKVYAYNANHRETLGIQVVHNLVDKPKKYIQLVRGAAAVSVQYKNITINIVERLEIVFSICFSNTCYEDVASKIVKVRNPEVVTLPQIINGQLRVAKYGLVSILSDIRIKGHLIIEVNFMLSNQM